MGYLGLMVDLKDLCHWGAVHVVSYFAHENDVATGDRLETRQPERLFFLDFLDCFGVIAE